MWSSPVIEPHIGEERFLNPVDGQKGLNKRRDCQENGMFGEISKSR
jgi:hypothetical protein